MWSKLWSGNGCDIIMHAQVKSHNEWIWHSFDVFKGRNYTLFGILDGTREEKFEPIVKEYRGYPEDSKDKLQKKDYWDDDTNYTEGGVYLGYAHINWCTLSEVQAFDWKQKIPGYNEPFNSMEGWEFVAKTIPYLITLASQHGGSNNVRIVWGYSV